MASAATYGGFVSQDNGANLNSYSARKVYSQRNRKMQEVRMAQISGELVYDTPALLIAAATNLINAFKQDNQNFVYSVNGTEAHALRNSADCLSGVKVISTSFPKGDPAELATVRTWSATLQATYDACDDDLISWDESIEVVGTGGPLFVVVNTVAGIQTLGGPQAFYLAATTAQSYTQRGSAVGYRTWPDTPGPVDPPAEFPYKRRITQHSGRQMGNGLRFFRTSWAYYFARDPNTFGFGDFHPTSK